MKLSRPATYQDVLDAPSRKVAEIIDGKLYTHPRPAPSHANAASALVGKLSDPFGYGIGGPGGWKILFEPELHLCDDIVIPDLAGWRQTRMPQLPDTAYFALSPDWVCEVLSPSTRKLDLGGKRRIYTRERVKHIWIVDPEARSLAAFELRRSLWILLDTVYGDAAVSPPPFDTVRFNLGDLWEHVVHKSASAAEPVQAT